MGMLYIFAMTPGTPRGLTMASFGRYGIGSLLARCQESGRAIYKLEDLQEFFIVMSSSGSSVSLITDMQPSKAYINSSLSFYRAAFSSSIKSTMFPLVYEAMSNSASDSLLSSTYSASLGES